MRLFVALDIDEAARSAIAQLQQEMRERIDPHRSLKWVDPSKLHLTLVFIGHVADAVVPSIIEALSIPLDVNRFSPVFRQLGVFPSHGAPRVLWLGADADAARILHLQRLVAARLRRLDLQLEDRPFQPHLTLARTARQGAGALRFPRENRRSAFTGVRFPVDHVTLYQSRLSPAGSTYIPRARATLT